MTRQPPTTRQEAIARLRYRSELRSIGADEDSAVIHATAATDQPAKPPSSTPAPAKALIAVLASFPPWGRVLVALAVIAALAGSSALLGLVAKLWH